jgi:AcrR family transcriptional regulator
MSTKRHDPDAPAAVVMRGAHRVGHNWFVPAKRAYGGISAEERRLQRRAALLDAALEVIGTQGFAAMTISGLCKDTGLNDRYFSESFESREAIFSALVDRTIAEMAESINKAVADADHNLLSLGHAAIRAVIEYLTDDPRRARIAFTEAPTTPAVAQRRREVMDYFLQIAEEHLSQLLGGQSLPAPDDLRFAGVALFGTLMETTATWLAGGLNITRDELIDRQTQLGVGLFQAAYSPSTV